MSRKSDFEKHWRMVSQDQLSQAERKELDGMNELQLPPLRLPERKPSFFAYWKYGFGAALAAGLALVILPLYKNDLTAKGSTQISVFWERDGRVSPLTADSHLQDGDHVGARVNSAVDAVAYWAITSSDMKILSEEAEISSSAIELKSGVSQTFASSFQLTAPNQGENLVVIVCPKKKEITKPTVSSILNKDFMAKLASEPRVEAGECVFVGHRLRSLP